MFFWKKRTEDLKIENPEADVLYAPISGKVIPLEQVDDMVDVYKRQLILLGGFLFHLAWEVKGRYGLFYFVLLLPAAAEGLAAICDEAEKRVKKEE